jgi:hypothetical protein
MVLSLSSGKLKFEADATFRFLSALGLGSTVGSNRLTKSGPRNFFVSIDFLFWNIFLSIEHDKYFAVPAIIRSWFHGGDRDNAHDRYCSRRVSWVQLSFCFRKLIAQAVGLGVEAGYNPRFKRFFVHIEFLRWFLSVEACRADFSLFVALERLIGVPGLLVGKSNAKHSHVNEDTLKFLNIKLPIDQCDPPKSDPPSVRDVVDEIRTHKWA